MHEHTDECYLETEETEESGCITKGLDCSHEHDESCGYVKAQKCGYVCESCNGAEPETENTGDDTENNIENDTEDTDTIKETENKKPEDADTSLCAHHREHTAGCGYSEEDNTPCGYDCRICPIEDLIAALPNAVTEDNRADTEARLQELLALFSELTEDEQEQVDISRCLELQEKLDAASAVSPLADEITLNSRITINSGNLSQYNNKVITGTTTTNYLTISGVTVSLTIKDLNLQVQHSLTDTDLHHAGIKLENNATLNLTLEGTNTIKGGTQFAAINVPAGCTLTINGSGSLTATGGDGAAGIGANWGGATESSIMTVGTIIINSGTINAYGLSGGAGIGGTMKGSTGRVEIHGGTVYAEGSGYRDSKTNKNYHSAAGIGGGSVGKLESIRITGGSVTARGYLNPDGGILAASPGIGAGDSGYNPEGNILDCGSITISGGTVDAKGGGDCAIGFGAAYGSGYQIRGSVEITEDADIHLNGGEMNPMPGGYTMCTLAVTIYDKSITEDMSVSLACGGAEWSGTLKKSGGEPYCGSFTTGKLFVKGTASDSPMLTVTGGGKTWTKSVSPQANTAVTLGEKAYQYYTLKGTIYDINITENMTANVRAGEWTGTAELRKTVAYCGEFSVDNLILPLKDETSETLVEITAGGNTWAGNASAGRDKTMTIGTLIEPAVDTFDLAYGSVTFEEKDGALQVTYSTETEKDLTYGLSDASKVYEVIQSRPDTPTGGTQLRIINTTSPLRIRLTNVRMDNQTEARSPIDVMGSAVLELAGENILVSNSGVAALYVQSGKNLTLTGSGSLDARVNLPDGAKEDDMAEAAIGGSEKSDSGMIVIESGRITATGSRGGAGIGGGGGRGGSGNVTITGGTVTAFRGSSQSDGIGNGFYGGSGNVTITGGSIKADSVRNPQNSSNTKLACMRLQLKDAGSDVSVGAVSGLDGYGFHDVRTLDAGYIYAYLPSDVTPPTKITAGGVDYLPESENSTIYIADFQVTLTGYPLTKMYDGIAMANPGASQVTCNVSEYSGLAFAWYQDDAVMNSAPVNAGSYTLRVSSDKGSKDFTVDIAKRPLTITVGNQTIDYNGTMKQTEYAHGELAEGDSLTVSLAASETAPGTHEGAIKATAQITRNGADVTGNYIITSTPGTLTVNKIAPAVSSWPAASDITYGQALGDSNLAGGACSVAGTFSWTAPDTRPNAGTGKFEVTFTPADTNYDTVTTDVTVTVARATPMIAWSSTSQELTYTGQPANIGPVITLVNNEEYTGEIHYQWGGTSDSLVPPTDAGTYTVHASIPQQDNYTAAGTPAVLALTINKADQTAPSAPTAGDGNIKDTSITLDTIENAEYSRDGTNWQDSPEFTKLSPNTEYTFYARLKADDNHNASSNSNGAAIKTKKTMLDNADVTVSGTYTYDGQAKTPEITVRLNGAEIPSSEYDITYSNSAGGADDHASAGTVTVTVTAKDSGNYEGTATGTFRIAPAPLTVRRATAQGRAYDGTNKVAITAVTLDGLVGSDTVAVDLSGIQGALSGANAGTYTAVTLPQLTLTGADSGNYTLVQPQTPVSTSVEIVPLDAVITVGTDTYHKTFGEGAFTLDVTDNNTEADVQYEVTKGTDVVSVENGTVTIRNAGTAEIRVSLPASTNYKAAENKTITVTVDKKNGYTVAALNRIYFYQDGGTDSIDLGALLPKDCGNVAYGEPAVSGNLKYSAAPAVSGGKLSYTLGSGNVNDEGTITVAVATRNYEGITVTVNVKLTDQIPVSLKTGTEVTLKNNVLTYGEPLSDLVFNGAEFVGTDGKTVAGTLAWKEAAATPAAGTVNAVWVFTPAEDRYASLEGTAAITVNKAVPTVSAVPTVADRIYNPSATLKDDDLSVSGITVTGVDGSTLEGAWNWQGADIVPTVNNSGYVAVFTPKDTTDYKTVSRTITVNVAKATPYIAKAPTAAEITYGETLNDSALTGGTVQYGNGAGQAGDGDGDTGAAAGSTNPVAGTAAGSANPEAGAAAGSANPVAGTAAGNTNPVAGTFTWKEPYTKPAVADSNVTEYMVVFTPSDTANYSPVEVKVTLTVNKAQNAPNMPGSTMDVPNSLEKVGDVSLPEGWEWQASDRDSALEVGKPVSAVAVYAGADKGNYEKETVTVAITRSVCDHVAGDVLYTGAGEKAPNCTEDGLGHRECTRCGSVVESGIVVKALGHTGGTATCSKRAVCTRCNQPYGDLDSGRHGDTEVRGFTAATCTVGGYTGDTYCKDCGAKTKTGNATPALGHNYTSTVTKEPTTGSEGTRTYICTRCGHSYTESIPKLPEETHHHSYTDNVTKQPTCTDTGVRTYTCSCGDSYTETIAALGHHYQGSVTKQPTTTAEGVMTYTCTRCGHSYTRPIAKLPGDDTTKPGDDTAKPGTSQPGDTKPGGGSTEETRPDTGIPFIKDEDGKTGWDVIRAEEEKAEEGSTINVDMNGTTVVPGDVFDRLKGKDITITFDMGNGILWSVDGKSITGNVSSPDKAGDIDFSVQTGMNTVPVNIVNNVTGERYSIQISLAHEGEFGFTAVLSIGLGRENAGYTASLYYYNESTGELEFICKDQVAEDGTVSLAFTHASDYVIAIDGDEEEESGNAAEPGQPDTPDGDGAREAESPQSGQARKPWWLIVAGALAIVMGIGAFFVAKKKQGDGDSGQ